jgi:TRAP-type C4-dicarboxylate transport system substrate-binding protein
LGRQNTSFVAADEIDSLLKGIDYIAKIGNDITKHENFEVDYRTKGDLRISVFNSSRSGNISAVIASGRIGRTQTFIGMRDLEEFRKLIDAAKAKL